MAVGRLHDQLVSFISYYAPNAGQLEFFRNMLQILLPKVQGQVIMGGDSNIPLDRTMDKSDPIKPILRRPPASSCKVARLFHSCDLIDIWRECNSSTRDFTYYSQVHRSFSRIDHLLVRTPLLPYVTSAKILTTPWSDHSPIKLTTRGLWTKATPSPWRLNASLLNDPVHYAEIEKGIQAYFEVNKSTDTSPAITWAAHKATIRGQLIQLASRLKRTREQTILRLEDDLEALLSEQHRNPQIDLKLMRHDWH